jgi:hypothetical protein
MGMYVNTIDMMDANINGNGGIKAMLKVAVGATASTDAIVSAYVNFSNSCKTLIQTNMSGAMSSQINTASEILLLANLNN